MQSLGRAALASALLVSVSAFAAAPPARNAEAIRLRSRPLGGKLKGKFSPFRDLHYSAGGGRVAALMRYPDSGVDVWDVSAGKLLSSRESGTLLAALITPDGERVVTDDSKAGLEVWDARGRRLHRLLERGYHSPSLTMSPDGREVACVRANPRANGVIERWEIASGKKLASLPVSSGRMSVD